MLWAYDPKSYSMGHKLMVVVGMGAAMVPVTMFPVYAQSAAIPLSAWGRCVIARRMLA